ncbi:MAG TPA: DUF368 domain-containing protein [Bacilli bacterium]|nr:DUF368 domain-containing protein [Bacilli bacterium]
MKSYLKKIVQGLLLGFALISGMGGGTVAVLIGIYDELIASIANFPKNPKKELKVLWPWAVGMIIGIGALIVPLKLLLDRFPIITISFVVGLTLGGFRELTSITKGHANLKNIFLAIAGILIAASIGAISWYSNASATFIPLDFQEIILLFIIGFFASAALVAPGISGTQFLLAIGYFSGLLQSVTDIFKGVNTLTNILALGIFAIGIIIGFFVISIFMKWCLAKFRVPTYYAILGFIVGSIFACYFNGDVRSSYSNFDWITLVLSLVALTSGFAISFFALKYASDHDPETGLAPAIKE